MLHNNSIENFLKQNFSQNLVQYRINLYNSVRDFVYQTNGAFSPEKLLEAKEGYCVPKHRLLKKCFDKLGYETKLCFVPFRFSQINLPDNLKGWGFYNKDRYHVFLKLKIDNKWIDIDASWNKELKNYLRINENWDGISNQKVIFEYDKVYYPKTEEEEKEVKTNLSDPKGFDDDDRRWVGEFNKWIKDISV